jgi:predicted RNA binding protein YcfA (HicA-like mRNA interferase family)
VTEAEAVIDYLDPDGFKRTHTVRSEVEAEDFSEDVREVVETLTKDGFFLEMEEKRYVFIPPSRVLRITFNLIDEEDGS